jgi:hypothetical protein
LSSDAELPGKPESDSDSDVEFAAQGAAEGKSEPYAEAPDSLSSDVEVLDVPEPAPVVTKMMGAGGAPDQESSDVELPDMSESDSDSDSEVEFATPAAAGKKSAPDSEAPDSLSSDMSGSDPVVTKMMGAGEASDQVSSELELSRVSDSDFASGVEFARPDAADDRRSSTTAAMSDIGSTVMFVVVARDD